MAINQPGISKDQIDNAWKLEVTNQANSEEARVNALVSRLDALEKMLGISGGGIITSVDVTPPSILRLENGRLSAIPDGVTPPDLQITNYVQAISANQLEYTFSGPGLLTETPHQLFVGGQKLIETLDYTPSSTVNGMITLSSQPTLPTDGEMLMIELTIWSI